MMATPRGECTDENAHPAQELRIPTPKKVLYLEQEGGGYDCEFVEPPPKALQTDCSICLQILREPYLISCCGHNFCRLCIERIQQDGKPCPLCNELSFTLMHNKGLQRTLKEFCVRCTHQKAGCQWTGELGKLDQHLNVNHEPEKQLEGCSFVEVECLYCHEYLPRRLIKDHQEEQCPRRPYSCDYCREYSSTFEDVKANHWPVCPCYFVSCPNECNWPHIIERQNLNHHLAKECPLQVVDCDFHYAGCEVRLPRKDMPQHLTENFTHMSLLATLNQKLANQLLEKDKQNAQLIRELRNEIDEVRRENKELKERVGMFEGSRASKQQFEENSEVLKREQAQETRQHGYEPPALENNFREKIEALEQRQATLEQQQRRMKVEGEGLKLEVGRCIDALHQHISLVPFQIDMNDFAQRKRNGVRWYSEPFYAHPRGYKMRLYVNPNGYRNRRRVTHVGVYVSLMRGEYDEFLKWPFRGDVTIQLLNQLGDSEHYTMIIPFTDQTPDEYAGRVTRGERVEGWGYNQFISIAALIPKYLKDDRFCFRVSKVDLK